jgi:hypothetical protein
MDARRVQMARERQEIAELSWPSDAAPHVAVAVKALRAALLTLEPWAESLPTGVAKVNAQRTFKQWREMATTAEQKVLQQ